VRYIVNFVFLVLPISRCFAFKRGLLKLAGVQVGDDAKINGMGGFYGHGFIQIGASTWVGPGCRFYSVNDAVISIGQKCDIAPEVTFIVGTHDIGDSERRAGPGRCDHIYIEDGCWIGTRSTVLGGVRIGRGTVVGAGSLVNASLPENCVAAGVPAKPIRFFESDGKD